MHVGGCMIWEEKLLVGRRCQSYFQKRKQQIEDGIMHPCVYLLVLPQEEHAVLEIIPSLLLLQSYYPKEQLHIIGMAASKKEALALTETYVVEACMP